jgi:hypothetical protein
MRRLPLVQAVLVGALALSVPTGAAETAPTTVRTDDCINVNATPKVPRENVAYLVPEPFRSQIVTEPDAENPGREFVALQISANRCEALTIGDDTRATIWAVFGVPLDVAFDEDFDERHPQPLLPLHLDDYRFWYVSDNPEFVELLRREGGLGRDALYVEGLSFELDFERGTFTFDAPAPAPSPFRIEATVTRDLVGPFDVSVHHYSTTARGWTANVEGPDGGPVVARGVRLGTAAGRVFAERGTQLDRILCGDTDGSFGPDPAGVASFDTGGEPGMFAITHDQSRPGFTTPRARCPRLSPPASFAGAFSSSWVLDGDYTRFFVTREPA